MSDRNPDITAALGLLLTAWRTLPMAQQSALRRSTECTGGRRLQWDCHARTFDALKRKALVGAEADPRRLTPEAMILRAVGMRSEAAGSKRRYARRRNPSEKVRRA